MFAPLVRGGVLLALAIGSTLGSGSAAEARRLASTVVVGRVTDGGRPLSGATISVAGRSIVTRSAADGRYALTIPRAGDGDRVTLLARRVGYEPWQRAVALRGDTVRVDVALTRSATALEEVVVDRSAPVAGAATGESRNAPARTRNERERLDSSPASVSASPAPTVMAQRKARADAMDVRPGIRRPREPWNTEAYERIDENPFRPVSVAPLSTFSVDVDRASYANVRRFLNPGTLPPKDAVSIE
jgi:Ca-activated chloride channel family protein